jgi:hypothetical protein
MGLLVDLFVEIPASEFVKPDLVCCRLHSRSLWPLKLLFSDGFRNLVAIVDNRIIQRH